MRQLFPAAFVDLNKPVRICNLNNTPNNNISSRHKKRALYAGLAFSLSIFISYYLMGIGLYSAIQATGISKAFYVVMAIVAIVIGLFNLKDYLWYGKWFIMEVPLSWRPRMKTVLKGITSVPGRIPDRICNKPVPLPCTSYSLYCNTGLIGRDNHKKPRIIAHCFA